MIKSEIGWLVWFFNIRLKRSYQSMLGKGVYGKRLTAAINEKISISEFVPDLPISLKGAPMPYEILMELSNAADCQDWIKDNNYIFA